MSPGNFYGMTKGPAHLILKLFIFFQCSYVGETLPLANDFDVFSNFDLIIKDIFFYDPN